MRVVYFTEALLPHVDGVSRTLARLFASLERQGIDFRIVSPFQPDDSVSWSWRVRRVPYVRFPLYPDYRISYPVPGLPAELDEYAPDLVHVVSPTPMAIWAQHYARRRGLPVVSSFHTHFVSYLRYYGVPWLEELGWRYLRWFYNRCDAVYPPTYAIIRELEEQGIQKLQLWSRGIDLGRFSPRFRDSALRAAAGAGEETPILLLVSRLVKEKDLLDLVEVDRLLRERGTDFRLVFVGDGPLRGELEEKLPHAHFAGHQTGESLARWYASADVFVFPSTTETLGNVVLEALASAVPAVVVDRGGPQELITPGENGFVARANDTLDIADQVDLLLRDPETRRRMERRARESAAARDWEAINGGLIESYTGLIASRDLCGDALPVVGQLPAADR